MPNPPLQPLRIPSNWMVSYNDFYEIDPETISEDKASFMGFFHEDLLQLKRSWGTTPVLIDLGWYPDGDVTGTFQAMVIRYFEDSEQMPSSWNAPLAKFESTSRLAMVAQIEEWLRVY